MKKLLLISFITAYAAEHKATTYAEPILTGQTDDASLAQQGSVMELASQRKEQFVVAMLQKYKNIRDINSNIAKKSRCS